MVDVTGGWRIDETDGGQKGRFAGTAGTEQSDDFALPDLHRGVPHGNHFGVAAAVDFRQSDRFDGIYCGASLSCKRLVGRDFHGLPDAQYAGQHRDRQHDSGQLQQV